MGYAALIARTRDLADDDLMPVTRTLTGMRDVASFKDRPHVAAWLAEAASMIVAERFRRRREIRDLERQAGRTTAWWGDADPDSDDAQLGDSGSLA